MTLLDIKSNRRTSSDTMGCNVMAWDVESILVQVGVPSTSSSTGLCVGGASCVMDQENMQKLER